MQNFVRQFHYIDEQRLPLIRGIGIGQGSKLYDWDARTRKDQLIVLQVTLSGKGFLETGEQKLALTKNTAFFAKIPGNYRYFGEEWRFLFIEFSVGMTQWLDTPFTTVTLSDAFVERLQENVTDLNKRQLTVTQNAKIAFALFLDMKEAVQKANPKTETIQAIKEYMDTHYFEDISLDNLTDQYGLSKYRIIRQFEAAYTSSPMHYLKKVRIIQSLSLLWEGESVDNAAKKVGFTTGNYFSKVFRKEMGFSPSEYKRQKAHYYPD